jgi:hypothetical protein
MMVYAESDEKQFAAVFASAPPVIDGILDDEVWQTAAVIEDFHEVEPNEFSPPKEKLRFRVLYDEDNLYVGAEINMHVDEVTAFKLSQGSNIQEEDRLKVVLDPYNNKRTGYDFRMNPNGVREEKPGPPNSRFPSRPSISTRTTRTGASRFRSTLQAATNRSRGPRRAR